MDAIPVQRAQTAAVTLDESLHPPLEITITQGRNTTSRTSI